MSRYSELKSFCLDHDLDARKSFSLDAFRRDEVGLPWQQESGGECPACGKHSVKVSGAKWFCFYCPERGVVPNGIELTPKQQAAERRLREEKRAENRELALKIWNDKCVRITPTNTTVSTYFPARGLSLERIPDLDGVMRWYQQCPFGHRNRVPCIVSLFRDVLTDEPMAIHRTHITDAARGKKDEPMALGPISGSAIKLWPRTLDQESLTIGEGIETVMAAVELKFGSPPAWAATVANNLSRIPVVPGVKRLTIAADNDGEGQKCANILRRKWLTQGKEVVAKIPSEVGWDFNDVLIRGRS